MAQLRREWEGRVVEGKFPLQRQLGSSDHSLVFLTEYAEQGPPQKAAIKLIRAEALERDEGAQLALWQEAAKLSDPHLIKLLEFGRCQLDNTRFLFVVTEYADENLSEILPLRPLSPDEAEQMLRPAAAALDTLHRAKYVHGHIKPSNVLAVNDEVKISIDGLSRRGERGGPPNPYDAPEKSSSGVSPEGDVWSLGRTLVAVLTQKEPALNAGNQSVAAVPSTVPNPLHDIAQQCLRIDPQQRCTAAEILNQLAPKALPAQAPDLSHTTRTENPVPADADIGRKKTIAVIIGAAVLLLVALVAAKLLQRNPTVPEANSSQSIVAPGQPSATDSSAPFTKPRSDSQTASTRGSVAQQVMPEISPGALRTIQGRVRVSVRVDVDPSGSVSKAKIANAGPSKYFADRALAAARKWKFNPAKKGGQPAESEWMLRFQFRRSSIDVSPSEIRP